MRASSSTCCRSPKCMCEFCVVVGVVRVRGGLMCVDLGPAVDEKIWPKEKFETRVCFWCFREPLKSSEDD